MMKKFYSLAIAALFGTAAMAQIDVTFRVDMNGQTVGANGVHVAGSWQAAAGFPEDWQPGTAEMTDGDADGIYELTVNLPAGQYQYKYVNGNAWGSDEGVPPLVATGGNRFFAVTLDGHGIDGFVLPAVQFGMASPEGLEAARLEVDLSIIGSAEAGVHVAGNIIEPNWTPSYGTCFNTANDIWAYVVYNVPGTYNYKFINGDDWGPNEWPSGGGPMDCTNGSDRVIELMAGGVSTPAYCFNTCETCSDPNVFFTVDMSGVATDNGGYIAGEINGWSGQPMTDNGDGTYTVGFILAEGTYQFKFQNGFNGWEEVPGECNVSGNRVVEVPAGDEVVEYFACFAQCTAECVPDPDPANITFRVDMNEETVAAEGLFFISGFLGWQGGALAMTDTDGDGIYEVTVNYSGPAQVVYKYVNGDVNVVTNEEFDGFPESPGPCTISNGNEGWNRFHIRSGEDEVLPVVPYNSCGVLSTTTTDLGTVNIYPNPSFGSTFVEIENPNNHTLRMSIIDVTGKTVRDNILLNTARKEINTSGFAPGLYFLNVVNEKSERSVYKLMVR